MEDGSFTMFIEHIGGLEGKHEVKATYHLVSGDVTGNDMNNWPLMEYEISLNGVTRYKGEMLCANPRAKIYDMFLDLCLGVR